MKDFWNQKFDKTPLLYGELPNVYFKEKLKELKPEKIFLPGDGEGRNGVYAASLGWRVVALDQSEVAKANALQLADKKQVSIDYLIMDIQEFSCEEQFDTIAMIYFHLPISILKSIHDQLNKCLKKGGNIIIEGFGRRQLDYNSGGPKDKNMLYDLEELKSSFPDFIWKEQFDGILDLKEGKGHDGPAHVIRLFGTKI
ncbi:Tellurite resistance protein TehB [Belliella baltica DSM 15883]|uniref:Tellurite resistance protein TehB n=1 Tax=Belliella baltica (strain DSM 15883 / CIP 108006 / LMG 21964 / BA134) TaxID=866536 RepID=I3Z6M7_BELBD|nr:class I SAM-dependent methyltransferase [Belliella baltica]AFL84895.1 Tellurite resistance protein TehB [Belliella baltica DSM 15883]